MSDSSNLFGLLTLTAWIAWAIGWALVLRIGLSIGLARTVPNLAMPARVAMTYGLMTAILIASFYLHLAVLGPGNLYGATPREAFSLAAYLVAPFGLPLLVGGLLVMTGDVVGLTTLARRIAQTPRRK